MQDLTTGSLTRHLLKTSSFMLFTMVFQTLYFLVDLYWVGRLGKEAVAAVGIAGNLTFIVLAITQMLAVGTTTLVSHAAGRKDRERANMVFNQSQALAVLVGVLFLAIAMTFRSAYVRSVSADPETASLADDYLLWFVPAMALQFGMVGMGAALRGVGNFKPGMIVQTASVVINMIVAPFLIFGWVSGHPMGVAGAAISTLIAVIIGTIWLATFFRGRDSFLHFHPHQWKPQTNLWGQMLKIGLPAGAEFALMAVYLMIVYAVTRPFGAAAQAGFGIGLRLVQAGFMPVVALGFSVAPVAGQNVGAGKPERVKAAFRTAVSLAIAVMIAFAVLCHIAAAPMISVFSNDPQVIAVGTEYLVIVSWTFVASGVIYVASSMFQALGNTVPPLISSFSRLALVAVPVILLSRLPGFQLRWIWYISAAAVAFQMTANLLLLRREFGLRLGTMSAPVPEATR
jgi:putative MATE family efflux protein